MDDSEKLQQRLCSVDGCQRPLYSRGWCQLHYTRWYHKGDVGGIEKLYETSSLSNPESVKRVLLRKRLIDENGCWVWQGVRAYGKYGRQKVSDVFYSVHRLSAWLWLALPIDSPLDVLHKCDNPPCFNPDHLFVGTQSDNMIDMLKKGRAWTNKLTEDQVRAIRADPRPQTIQIARQYGVSAQNIRDIRARRTWKHVA